MLTKANIEQEKLKPGSPFFKNALAPTRDETTLLSLLDNLGKLPAGFNGELFIPLLTHANPKIRTLAVKNVGKLKDDRFLEELSQFAANERNTLARREAISAIGRMRSEKAIPTLTRYLTDTDPKVVLQSVRALLYFKENPEVQTALDSLLEHPNELIREHLTNEIKNKKNRQKNGQKNPHHPTSPDALKNVMVHADVQEALKLIPDESIHLTFTSPPYYNARDYTIYQSYEAYLDFLTSIFKETHRITKEGRFFVLNTSPVIVPRISRAHSSKRYAIPYDMHPRLTEIGWEFIDDIVWTKPDYAAKNRNGGFFQHRKPLGYKANSVTESVMVYRKKTDKLIDWNIRQYEATPYWNNGIYCIRLNKEPSDRKTQKIAIGVDPGSNKEGFTVKSESHTYLNVQADSHDKVGKKVAKRRELRRGRRSRKCPNRKNRMNRLANKERIPAGTRARWDWKLRILDWLSKLYPITHVCVEDIRARTIERAKRWNQSFSPLEVGKQWFYTEIEKRWKLLTLQGWETKEIRDRLGLKKSSKKLAYIFEAHCVDSWCLAHHSVGGKNIPDDTRIFCISPIPIQRRTLHREQPKKGGIRSRYGGTILANGLTKHTLVKHVKYGFTRLAGMNAKGLFAIYNLEGKRLTTGAKQNSFKILTRLNFNYRSGHSSPT